MRPTLIRLACAALVFGTMLGGSAALAGTERQAGGGSGAGVGFSLEAAKAKPRSALFDARRKPTLRYRFSARRRIETITQVVDTRHGRIVAAFHERGAEPGIRHTERWNGITRRGKAADDGRYQWRVGPQGGTLRFAGSFRLHGHVFPVDGPHGDRGPIGDFGAPRSGGRTHEGFDITGACGTPLLVARGGKVARVGFDPVLYGYYVLINGRKSNESYFYSHLIAPSPLHRGERVRTRERVGSIGQTGNAAGTPCHLHFELRRQGKPVDPEPQLRDWDGWS